MQWIDIGLVLLRVIWIDGWSCFRRFKTMIGEPALSGECVVWSRFGPSGLLVSDAPGGNDLSGAGSVDCWGSNLMVCSTHSPLFFLLVTCPFPVLSNFALITPCCLLLKIIRLGYSLASEERTSQIVYYLWKQSQPGMRPVPVGIPFFKSRLIHTWISYPFLVSEPKTLGTPDLAQTSRRF